MGDNGGSGNTGIVAVLVIFLIVVAALFFAWRSGLFGGRRTSVNVNVTVPQSSPQQQAPPRPQSSP
jgi:hypothetical protein